MCVCVCVCVCLCVRAHAGDGEGFLEDGVAGKLSLYRHGNQSGGSGQGEFIIREITKYVCVCVCVCVSMWKGPAPEEVQDDINILGVELDYILYNLHYSLIRIYQINQK